MTRLEHLREAIRLERLWDLEGGPDNSPRRNVLKKQIDIHRKEYDRMTKEGIDR